ncbi:GFA family protein [Roseomonas xinghualingensis]|uniref:GFA family protein n=1 Tax=Roseomonas xinghualingensis TaxID=2986475 RepID=UPI0021F21741|nr:GFA family protein [Roseomonas sp. SXEYE001]MCV4207328.1 GFA family protein [Roseomonas sp. SXEYE001]
MESTDTASVLTGGCHCGRLRYEARGTAFHPTICHCVDCRRIAGSPCVAWFSVERNGFRVVAGEMRLYASSTRAERGFCGYCGTPLTFQAHDLPDEIDITTASLDEPERVPPLDHTRVARRLSWMRFADGLPAYPGSREEGLARKGPGGQG